MKRIGLIDCDHRNGNTFPNLALMKISAWHKAQKNCVEWYMPFDGRYDIVYISKVFSFSPDYTEVVNADKVIRGGTGYQITAENGKEYFRGCGIERLVAPYLPDEIEHIYPDYSLYGITDTAYGFLTRGCPRGCSFCHVASKEGQRSRKVADLSEFWHGQKNIVLMDPNILACRDRKDLLRQLIKSRAYVDINQGLDVRMLDEELCELLSEIKIKNIHFAWDRWIDGNVILPKLELYAKYGKKQHGQFATVYTLVNYDTTLEQDLDRIYTLRDMGYYAYVMVYDKEHCAGVYKKLQRWCNNRIIFTSCRDFNDYRG